MGKKIAILLGISEYINEENLPPCQKDIELMSSIVSGSEKYDDVLLLDNSPKSNEAKDKISAFIRKNQKQDIEEALVYYTGHGARNADDFLYLFSDYNKLKVEQTSLRNSEFDSMLKSLNPALTVKIVDACQAGTEYIKSNQDLQVIFEKSSSTSFNKTYFLFSSSNTESSIALQDYSVFTKSFAKSLLDFEGQDIRYRDVMAFISDDNNVKKHQTPLFIQQADNTEIFCNVSSDLSEAIHNKLSKTDLNTKEDEKTEINENSETKPTISREELLIQAIKKKGKEFCSEEEAQNSLTFLTETIINYKWPNLIEELFSIEATPQQHTVTLNSKNKIAKWIQNSEESYFVRMTYDQEEYQSKEKIEYEESDLFGVASMFGKKRIEYQPVTRYRKVISGYELTAPSPSQTIMFALSPKEEVLPWFKIFFTHIFSKSKLTLFFKHEIERETSWKNRELEDANQWKTKHCKLKNNDEIAALIQESMENVIESITEEISAVSNVSLT